MSLAGSPSTLLLVTQVSSYSVIHVWSSGLQWRDGTCVTWHCLLASYGAGRIAGAARCALKGKRGGEEDATRAAQEAASRAQTSKALGQGRILAVACCASN